METSGCLERQLQNHWYGNPVSQKSCSYTTNMFEGHLIAAWIMFTHKVFLSEGKCYALIPTQYDQGGWWTS